MNNRLLTFSEIAAAVCADEGRLDQLTDVKEQLRGTNQRGLIEAEDHKGPRGAARITLEAACRARILIALLDLGATGSNLALLNEQLRHTGRRGAVEFSMAAVIERTANGEDWVFAYNMVRDHSNGGALTFSGRLRMAHDTDDLNPSAPVEEGYRRGFLGATHIAFVKLPVSRLIASIIASA